MKKFLVGVIFIIPIVVVIALSATGANIALGGSKLTEIVVERFTVCQIAGGAVLCACAGRIHPTMLDASEHGGEQVRKVIRVRIFVACGGSGRHVLVRFK